METHNLEKEFLKELAPKHGLIVQTGVRYSGKSLWSSCLLRHLMTETKLYDEYHLIIPTWRFQAKDTFRWVSHLPDNIQNKITVYEDFSINVISKLVQRGKKDKKHRYLYVDDATAFGELFGQSEVLKVLVTQARHIAITTHIITHHLKAVMLPLLRSNVSYYILHRNVNSKFLEGIYEENLSLFYERKDWLDVCRKQMRQDYPAIALDRDKQRLDCGAMDWGFIKTQRDLITKFNSIVYNKKDDNEEISKTNDKPHGCGSRKCPYRVQQGKGQQTAGKAPGGVSR